MYKNYDEIKDKLLIKGIEIYNDLGKTCVKNKFFLMFKALLEM